ncbi:sperm-associated antigen 5 [Leucoraja erinacea]|uniref:sperm-associated antigen 5 n=1 Tax=Leucoraja erinaceus TaxID=7782 RepID=UPI002456C6BA|nr:sperm-associated antigen 5 [Leucoraja erinacea]
MLNRRRSAKSSSSENEDQLASTPGRKFGRVPLQDVLLQCSAQRDMQRSSSKAQCMGVPSSNLTPLLCKLKLEDAYRPAPSLVFDNLCKHIFVDGVSSPATQASSRPGVRGKRSLPVTGTAEPAGGGAVREDDERIRGADAPPVNAGELVIAEAQEDPELSVSGAANARASAPAEAAAGQSAGSPQASLVGVSSPESTPSGTGSMAERQGGSSPGVRAGQGTQVECQDPLGGDPGTSEPAREEGEAGEREHAPTGAEVVKVGKRKRLSMAEEVEEWAHLSAIVEGESVAGDVVGGPEAEEGVKASEGQERVQLPLAGERLSIESAWENQMPDARDSKDIVEGVLDWGGEQEALAGDSGEEVPSDERGQGVPAEGQPVQAVDDGAGVPAGVVTDQVLTGAWVLAGDSDEGVPTGKKILTGDGDEGVTTGERVPAGDGNEVILTRERVLTEDVDEVALAGEGHRAGDGEEQSWGEGLSGGMGGPVEIPALAAGGDATPLCAVGCDLRQTRIISGGQRALLPEPVVQVDMGTSPLEAVQSCALACLIHPGSSQTPADTWRLLAAEIGVRRVTCREVSTAVTPVGSHCAMTCMTPVCFADKDVNTSVMEDVRCAVTDSAVVTDPLLWNFSRKDLESVPRDQLERRLETALTVNEVLSSQLSELWKSKGLHLGVGPADQREAFTQTSSTQALEVEQLYLAQTSRVREQELSVELYQQLQAALADTGGQQSLLLREVEDGLRAADGTCEQMQRERARMSQQLEDARQLARQSTRTLQATGRATSKALEEAAAMKEQVAEAEWKQANMQQELEHCTDRLREALAMGKQLSSEKLQLKSDLETMNHQLAGAEAEREKLMKDNGRYFVELATAEASRKLSEAALAESTERLQACEVQNKEMVDSLLENVQSLKEDVNKLLKEKGGLERAASEAQGRVLSLTRALQAKDVALQELSDIRAQAALISDNFEFMEQEVKMSREQLSETEGQLSEQIRSLHHRNLQCEELRTRCDRLRSELDMVKKDAREMLMEMGEQMNQAIVEIMEMDGQMQNATRSAETTLKIWQQDLPKTVAEVKAEPPVAAEQTSDQAAETGEMTRAGNERKEAATSDIRSEQSAFAPIKPTGTDIAADMEDTLQQRVCRLHRALGKLLAVRTQAESVMKLQVQELQREISVGREQQEAKSNKKQLELHSLQSRVGELEAENRQLARELQAHAKTKCELEQALESQNETIFEFNKLLDSNLEEHSQFLAMKQQVTDMKRQLQQVETEASTYREEFAKLQGPGDSLGKDWLQEKVDLQQQVRKLRGAYLQKDGEIQQLKEKMFRHRAILEENNQKAEAEVRKLDNLIEHIRRTLHSIPEVVGSSAELKCLLQCLGDDLAT